MRDIRIFVDQPLVVGQTLSIRDETAHYLLRVLRVCVGQSIHLFNGQGGYYVANITETDRRSLSLMPANFNGDEKESSLNIVLAQGLSRGQKMDYTIQKAVELGVNRIVPVMSEFSNVKLTDARTPARIAHWKKIIISTCEQCGRNRIPEILAPVPLKEWVKGNGGLTRLVLDPGAEQVLADLPVPESGLVLLSGPEGGLSDIDLDAALRGGYQPVRLGPRILRTETAAVAAITVCQSLWGDMGQVPHD